MNAPGACAAALAALLAAGAPFAAGARADDEAPALPADVERADGVPPFRPGPGVVGRAQLDAWAARVTALARGSTDEHLCAELLLGAAAAVRGARDGARRAAGLALEAHNALPWHDPLAALALLETVETWLDMGAYEPSRPALARLRDWRALPGPVDPDAATLARWRLAHARLDARYPPALARYWEGLGRPLTAAEALLPLTQAPPGARPAAAAAVWERIARLRWRAGRRDDARAAAIAGREVAADPDLAARLALWTLHLDHGLLRADGALGPALDEDERRGLRVPGAEYVAALTEAAQRLSGNPHLGGYLLAAASGALVLGAYEAALAVYRLALDDPHVRRSAWHDVGVSGGLLPAVDAALRLARFDEAEALLGEVEALAGAPLAEADGLRVRIRLARARSAERARGDAPPADEPRAPRAERPSGTLAVPSAGNPPPRARDAPAPPAPDGTSSAWLALAAAAGAAALAGLGLARARGRRRR